MMRATSVSYQRDPIDDLRPAARRKRTDPDAAVGVEWIVDAFDCTHTNVQDPVALDRTRA